MAKRGAKSSKAVKAKVTHTTAAELHEAARVARRAGLAKDAGDLIERARAAERIEARG